MKKRLSVFLALFVLAFAARAYSAPAIGTNPASVETPPFTETKIDSRYDGQVVSGGVL